MFHVTNVIVEPDPEIILTYKLTLDKILEKYYKFQVNNSVVYKIDIKGGGLKKAFTSTDHFKAVHKKLSCYFI